MLVFCKYQKTPTFRFRVFCLIDGITYDAIHILSADLIAISIPPNYLHPCSYPSHLSLYLFWIHHPSRFSLLIPSTQIYDQNNNIESVRLMSRISLCIVALESTEDTARFRWAVFTSYICMFTNRIRLVNIKCICS